VLTALLVVLNLRNTKAVLC